jgi:pilus assembly protein CpaC
MRPSRFLSSALSCSVLAAFALVTTVPSHVVHAQTPATQSTEVIRTEIIAGRSLPITDGGVINKVTVANPAVADVVVIGEQEVVINGIAAGETDIILWGPTSRRHYRVVVRSSPERRQVLLSVKFAEVRRETLRQIGTSLLYRPAPGTTRVGTGVFGTGDPSPGGSVLPSASRYLTVLSTFNSKELLGLLDAEEQLGNARSLAEPNLMAANREPATFLAGGEIPVPVVQGSTGGAGSNAVTIEYREFGIRLEFIAEVLSDSLLKLKVRPEVSTLDYGNAILLSGFRVPALRTRRVESTVDVLEDRSLIISGLFNEEREQVRTGLPFLGAIPILGQLFASSRWMRNESELIVVVTPVIMDPNNPRAADLMNLSTDPNPPALPALQKRIPPTKPPR